MQVLGIASPTVRWSHGAIASLLISLLVVPIVLLVLGAGWARAENARSADEKALRRELARRRAEMERSAKRLPAPNITNYGDDDDSNVDRFQAELEDLQRKTQLGQLLTEEYEASAALSERDLKRETLVFKVSLTVFGFLELACGLFAIDALLRIRNNAGALRGGWIALVALVIAAGDVLVVAVCIPVVLGGVSLFVST
jgi:hypothetical protein